MRLYLSVIVVILIVFGFLSPVHLFCDNSRLVNSYSGLQENQHNFIVSSNDTGGWGFQIFRGAKLIIIQNHIPAISGMSAFSDSNQAVSVANLMKKKLDSGIFPPGINMKELDSLQVIY